MSPDDALRVLATMERIRRFEERVARLKLADEVYGLVHVSVGQEGVAAGTCPQLRADDAVYSGHRAHGHALAKGAPMERVMAELMGRQTGLCQGMGGSMHLVDTSCGFLGATGVVGGNVPLALGAALAARLRGDDAVAVVFFGDGAAQGGHVLETFNLAALWALPLIMVCENNGFAEFTPRSAHTVVERVSDAVAPYAFARETVDGNDVRAVWGAFGAFVQRARAGEGPFLLECLTQRLSGHYVGDPAAYREALDADEWQRLDPIVRLRAALAQAGELDADAAAALGAAAADEVAAAEAFARASAYPPPGLTQELAYA